MKRFVSAFSESVVVLLLLVALLAPTAFGAEKLPADKAGAIGQPAGQIAFIRDNDIWVMNADGGDHRLVCQAQNADGRLSWALDNRRVVFTRSGKVDIKGPDLLGGWHKIYDLFVALLDSAEAGNTMFWYRMSEDLGSRDAQWTADGKFVFWKDINANVLNAMVPNYQICSATSDGGNLAIMRSDWKGQETGFLTQPSISPTVLRKSDAL